MATLLELSNSLAKIFIQSKNKKYAAKIIIREINSLLYSNTKQPVDYTMKIAVIQVITELIRGERPFQLPDKEAVPVTQKDVSKFSKLESFIREEVWKQHQFKEKELHVDLTQSNVSVKTFTLNFSPPQIKI